MTKGTPTVACLSSFPRCGNRAVVSASRLVLFGLGGGPFVSGGRCAGKVRFPSASAARCSLSGERPMSIVFDRLGRIWNHGTRGRRRTICPLCAISGSACYRSGTGDLGGLASPPLVLRLILATRLLRGPPATRFTFRQSPSTPRPPIWLPGLTPSARPKPRSPCGSQYRAGP